MKKIHLLVAVTAVLACACANGQNKPSAAATEAPAAEVAQAPEETPETAPQIERGIEEGQLFTDFTITQEDGTKVSLSDYVGKGKFVLVDFWASWCGPCRREIPNIKAVWEKYHGDSFEVLSVAVWDKPADSKAAIAEEGLAWPQIINAQQVPTDIYGIEGIPHIILFGPDGVIVKRNLRGPQIEQAVKAALGL